MEDFPFKCEYSKSNRASCRTCKNKIEKEELRLAVMVQSRHFDGKQPNWYHFKCFFVKQRPKSTNEIENFGSLRWEDQEKLKKQLESAALEPVETKKGTKRKSKAGEATDTNTALNDFKIENAKSSRAKCYGCENMIVKGVVRISKLDFESEVGRMYGGQAKWYHDDCFEKLRHKLEFWESGKSLPGFKSLSKEDQEMISKRLPKIDPVKVKIEKSDNEDEPPASKIMKTDEDEKEIKKQNKIFHQHIDKLKTNITKKNDLIELLKLNNRSIPEGHERIYNKLADLMTFGLPDPCPECSGELRFKSGVGYKCTGDLTEWTKCTNVIQNPKKKEFVISRDFKEKYPALKSYKYVPRTRKFKLIDLPKVKKEEETDSGPLIKRAALPLENMQFYILGKTKTSKATLKDNITKLGGRVASKISENLTAVISTQDEIEDKSDKMSEIEDLKIHVIEEDVLKLFEKTKLKIADLIEEKSICNWGADLEKRLAKSIPTKSNKSKSIFTKSVPTSQKLTLKGGIAVDPSSNLEDVAHVLIDNKCIYNCVLGVTDLITNKNSFYKIQILESDKSSRYWLFRSWGRIGTTIGGNKVDNHKTKMDAIKIFKDLYFDKTGNDWEDRDHFKKLPGKLYPIDIEYEAEQSDNQFESKIPSKLPTSVQQLVKLIFDINTMKQVMKEFELDLEKMPLGKLSQKQLQKALAILTELQTLVNSSGSETKLIDATNRFYTLIPHSFGVNTVPIIRSEETIKQKIEMLNSLMEMSIAYSLIKNDDNKESNPIDKHYKKLETDIEPLDKESEEFKLLEKYVENTHAATHQSYKLIIEEVFKIKRNNEEKRYKPFKKLPNKKLLWHGSRLTNFAGILSQGLRIAPPEAPATGYMFGKGIYFADMVSKSANYCFTSPNNSTGLMLLCEVALGNMMECSQAKYVEKLPKDKHSCKGLGRTHPDPKDAVTLPNGVEVPIGKGVPTSSKNTSLLYNEYIVYDVAQVNMKYLLKIDFKYKY